MSDPLRPLRHLSRREFSRHALTGGALLAAGGLGLAAGCGEGASDEPLVAAPEKTAPEAAASPAPVPPAPPAGGAGAAPAGDDRLVTEIASNAALVKGLGYIDPSVKPDQHCATCRFFTPLSEERGRCQLFALGQVHATGWCTSWAARV